FLGHGDVEEPPPEFFVGHVAIGVHCAVTVSRPRTELSSTRPNRDNTPWLDLAEHPNRLQYGRFRADLDEDHTALTSTLDGGDDGMPRSDELAPPRSGEVSKQVGGAQFQVVAAGDAHLAGEPPPHPD